MKKLLPLILLSILLWGCKKPLQEQALLQNEAEISFSINLLDPGNLKDWECKTEGNVVGAPLLEPDYAHVIIDGQDYYPAVFRINGILYTQSIKIMLGDAYSASLPVTRFVLYDDGGTPGGTLPEADDQIVMGTPDEGSHYGQYMPSSYRLPRNITVTAFEKAQYLFKVLCFIDDDYEKFGFDWFMIWEIVIREECFFGDICIKDVSSGTGYAIPGSPYLQQSTGIQLDMPAIMEIHVKDAYGNHVPYSPFTNNLPDMGYGVGVPLCINWPDYLHAQNEVFNVEIWIMVQDGAYSPPFAYNLFWEGTLSDDGVLFDAAGNIVDPGADGIVDLVLGECNLSDTDIQLAPYQNLPATVTMQTLLPALPGTLGTFFDIELSGIVGIYDIHNQMYGVYCGDQETSLSVPQIFYNTEVYGSMYPELFPAEIEQMLKDNIEQANWLMNNLENYPGYVWEDIQNALWAILDEGATFPWAGLIPPTALSLQMSADAALYGIDYLPPPGGWAAIIFWNGTQVQVIFTFVDP